MRKKSIKTKILVIGIILAIMTHVLPTNVYAAALGSYKRPYTLEAGKSSRVYTKNIWYKCTVRGATDVKVIAEKTAKISIYKKNAVGKKLLYSKKAKSYSKKIVSAKICSNSNTYYIHVKMSSKAHVTCTVSQHQDKKDRAKGAQWTVKGSSPTPNSAGPLYHFYWYLPAEDATALDSYINSSKFLSVANKVTAHTITIASAIVLCDVKGPASVAAGIISGVAANEYIPDFRGEIIKRLHACGAYNSATRSYTKGVVLIEYMYNGLLCYNVKTWDGSTMYGASGMVGTWKTNYNK